jgi:O-antigen/teichoic acid export membrane protein
MSRRPIYDLLLAQASSLASSVIVTVVTAAVLNVNGRGEVAFVLAVGNLVAAIAFGSLHMSVVHAEEAGHGDARRQGLYVAFMSATGVLVSLAVAAALTWQSNGGLATQLLWAGCGGFLGTVNLFILRLVQALGDDARFRNAWAISGGTFAVFGCLAVLVTHQPRDVYLAWFAGSVLSSVFAARGVTWADSQGRATPRRRIIFDAWAAHAGTLGVQIFNRFNIVALGLWSSSSEVGIYSIAAPIAEATWILSEALSLLAFRSAARSGKRESRASNLASQAAVTLGGALIISVVAAATIRLLLPEFDGAVLLIFILVPGVIVQGLARVAMARLAGARQNRLLIRIGAASAVISLLYIGAASYGALGMAVTTSALYVAHGTVVLMLARRGTRGTVAISPEQHP